MVDQEEVNALAQSICNTIDTPEASLPSTSSSMENNSVSYTLHILELPNEVFEKILSYLNYEQISKVRRVSTRFNEVGSAVLNSAFQRLQNIMLQRFHQIKSQMPRRESARRTHPLARECDIVETVHMRLTLLQMSFGKHIERKHCCFFAGEILDEVYRIFKYIKSTPTLARAYKVTDELFDLTTMAMEYFKEYIEPDLPEITYFATDFLDYTPGVKSCTWKNSTPAGSPISANSPGPAEEPQELPTSNKMLKKKLKRLRQGMKRNNSRLTSLKREMQSCSNQIADQNKQLIDYGARFEDYDKKFEENSRKFSSVLQELNRCKTELTYWRSKSPANQLFCSCCSALSSSEEAKAKDSNVSEESDSSHLNLQGLASSSSTSYNATMNECEFVPIPMNDTPSEASSSSLEIIHLTSLSPGIENEIIASDDCVVNCSEYNSTSEKNLPNKRKASKVLIDEFKEHVGKRSKKTIAKCLSYQ